MEGIFDDLHSIAEDTLSPIIQDKENRGRSWDRCYSFFQRYHTLNQEQRQNQRELACLHLGFYLASWGMFRGRGFLIHKDYTIYGDLIDILLKQEYEVLWKPDYFRDLFMGEDVITEENNHIALIFKLAQQIREYFNGMKIIRNHYARPEDVRVSDTLITKILMGTLGCTPAYDRYFRQGLVICDIRGCGSFTIRCFVNLLNICRQNNLWATLQQQPIQYYGVVYPIMRVADLYFWTKGFNPRNEE